MTWFLILLLALTMLLTPAMARAQTTNPSTESAATPAAVAADNAFAAELYARLIAATPAHGGATNLFCSPYSIRVALAMTWAGARAQTARQMAGVLHLGDFPPDQVHRAFADLIKQLNSGSKDYQLAVANALWGQSGYGFRDDFKQLLKDDYDAELREVDFMQTPEPARLQINQWAEQKTNDKIKDLLAPGVIDAATRLVLTNAIYFKAAWEEPFSKHGTRDEPFHLDAAQTSPVPMMHRGQESLAYTDSDQYQAVALPYQGGELSMTLVVPKAVDGLSAVEKSLDAGALRRLQSSMQTNHQPVLVSMPKFKTTSEFRLSDQLRAMGMSDAFDPNRADFSGMVNPDQAKKEPPLVIGDVVHKAFVSVDEEGTEAAAATAVVMRAGAARQMQPPAVVTADRPFLFFISHRASGSILFLGRVADPRS
jgi:serpin B